MKTSPIFFALCIALFISVNGAMVKDHKPETIAHSSEQINHNVTIQVTPLNTPEACKQVFGPKGSKLLKKKQPIIPLQITITNNSDQLYYFHQDNIKLKLVDGKKMRSELGTSTPGRVAAALGVGWVASIASFFATAAITVITGLATGGLAAVFYGGMVAQCVLLGTVVTAPVVGYKSYKNNCVIQQDLSQKSPIYGLTIASGTQQSMYVFVQKKNLLETFDITLHDTQQTDFTCKIDMSKK